MANSEDRIGKKVRVYWENEEEWFEGLVEEYHPSRGFRIQYFDGDDEWLKSLDQNVEFIDDNNHKNISNILDEIEGEVIVAPGNGGASEKYSIDYQNYINQDNRGKYSVGVTTNDKNFTSDGENDIEVNILKNDFNNVDDYDHVEIEEDENFSEKMIALTGRIFGATALPPISVDEKDGRVFFRVLYVEGGSRSTMFQCKTTIYKSEFASDLQNPEWQNNSFRFEMMLPEDNFSQISLQGEILVALYRNRSQGGSEFIGQTSFQLEEIFRNQSSNHGEDTNNGICSHSCSGTYPLIARLGDVAGGSAEVEVDLLFKWRPLHPRPMSASPPHRRPSSRKGSVAGSRQSHGNALNSPSKLTHRPKSANISNNSSSSRSRSMVSHSAIRRKAEQARIERENNIIFKKLQKHQGGSTKATVSNSTVLPASAENKQPINKKPVVTSTVAAAKQFYYQNDSKLDAFSRISSAPPPPSKLVSSHPEKAVNRGGDRNHLVTPSKDRDSRSRNSNANAKEVYSQFDEMLSKFNNLKQSVASMESENQALKQRSSRMRSQLLQYEQALERLKKRNMSSAQTPQTQTQTDPVSSERKDSKESSAGKGKSRPKNLPSLARNDTTGDDPQVRSKPVAEAHRAASITTEEPSTGMLKPEDFEDREAREIAAEHWALQDVRRRLVARILTARDRAVTATESMEALRDRVRRVRSVLLDDRGDVTRRTREAGASDEHNQSLSDIVTQQRSAAERLGVLENQQILHEVVGPVIDDILETEAIINLFREKLAAASQELDRLTFERDTARDRLNDLNDDDLASRLRSAISAMNSVLGHARSRYTTEDLISRTNQIDIALLKNTL